MRKVLFFGLTACAALLAAAAAQAQEKLEIFSWLNGDQDTALQAIVQQYNARYPDVAVTNTAATVGPGADAKAVLRAMMLAGDPPDSFQTSGGDDLVDTWVIADRVQSLSGFFKTQGWTGSYPGTSWISSPRAAASGACPSGCAAATSCGMCRPGSSAWGVNPPRTWGELMASCQKLKDAGVDAPIALGDASTLIDLWESVAVATIGPDSWSALWDGRLKFTDARAVRTRRTSRKPSISPNPDSSNLTRSQVLDRVAKGDSAFVVMDDRAEAYLAGTLKLAPGQDFAWVPSPGTTGVFIARIDSFALPVGVRDVASTFKWLMLLGSKEAQDAFNPLNGSISPRLDSDLAKYSRYSQSEARDWRESRIVGSLAQGVVAPPSFRDQFGDVMGVFLAGKNPRAAASAAQAIADQAHLGK